MLRIDPFLAVLLSASAKGLNTGEYRHAQYTGVAGAMLGYSLDAISGEP
jgi:hypothetical protein